MGILHKSVSVSEFNMGMLYKSVSVSEFSMGRSDIIQECYMIVFDFSMGSNDLYTKVSLCLNLAWVEVILYKNVICV